MIVNLESSGAFIYGRVSRWERETPEIPKWFILGSHWIFGPLRPQLTRHERHWCMGADFEAARQQGNKATRYVAMLTHRCSSFLSKSNCRMALQFRQILYVVWFSGFFLDLSSVFFRIHLKPSSHSGLSLPFDIFLIYVYICLQMYILICLCTFTYTYIFFIVIYMCYIYLNFLFIFSSYIFSIDRYFLHIWMNRWPASSQSVFSMPLWFPYAEAKPFPQRDLPNDPWVATIIAQLSFRGQRWIKDGNRK